MEQATPFTTFLTWMAEALNRFHVSDVFCELIAPMTKPAEIELTLEAIEYGETATMTATGQGTSRVGRCSKWRPRRVSASTVAARAADGRGREFVSRSICTPTETSAHGKASRWRCTVVHNNSYRECTSPRRYQRIKFGRPIRKYGEHVGNPRCVSF